MENLLRKINSSKLSLSKSETRVADYVLQHTDEIISMRIIDLASAAEVSEPTVIRFCRAVGFDGFRSFKLQLAKALGSGSAFTQFAVDENDTIADLSDKVFDSTIGSLLTVRDDLDAKVLEKAISAIAEAGRVEFYGFGASGSVAADAQHKFFRLRLSTAAYTDPHIQHMSAISLGRKDVVVAISQSGKTKALLQSVKLAREAGATVIGLAPQQTPLSRLSSISIHVNMEEDEQAFSPVSSRIAHLLVIDVLAMGVARHRKPHLKDHLKRLNKSLRALRTTADKDKQ
jgi:RpiR family carbohydrate utilization transcriptional regulator